MAAFVSGVAAVGGGTRSGQNAVCGRRRSRVTVTRAIAEEVSQQGTPSAGFSGATDVVQRRAELKKRLHELVDAERSEGRCREGAPATCNKMSKESVEEMESVLNALSEINPNPNALINSPLMLNGPWKTLYSDAREITSLADLPYGFKLGEIYQVIDVATESFQNFANVEHWTGLVKGFVRVTASFVGRPTRPAVTLGKFFAPNGNKVRIQFKTREYYLTRVVIPLPKVDMKPKFVVDLTDGKTRTPSLDVLYLDEDLRIGGSESGFYVLEKIDEVEESAGIPSYFY